MEAGTRKSRNSAARQAQPGPHQPVRGRPTAEQVTSIDRAIVSTARTMFLAEGFDAVGMKQVAETARVSKGTLYARYPSKEALFKAVIEQTIEDWSAEASQQDDLLTDNIEQRLRHHAKIIATWLGRPDVLALQRLLLSVQERFPELSEVMQRRGNDYIIGFIARDIEEAAARDQRNLRDAHAVARLLVTGITGAHLQGGFSGAKDEDLQGFAQRAVDLILWGASAW
ncbi:MAG: TetR/AcrR family transcriptional regulator [Novosphingobium sp.]